MRLRIRNRVRGGALYYAIFVSFMVALLGGLLSMNVMIHHASTTDMLQSQRFERNISSAFLLLSEKPDAVKLHGHAEIDLYDDESDIITVSKSQWGGYFLIRASAGKGRLKKTSIALFGYQLPPDEKKALYLAEKGQALSLSGRTIIKGNCSLPKSGVRKAYIEGKSFSGGELIDGKISESGTELPSIGELLTSNLKCIDTQDGLNDSIINISFLSHFDTINNSFFNRTLQLYSNDWIFLDNKNLEGNIRVVSKQGVTISGSSKISGIIVCAPKIETEEDFSGTIQLFATDSIIVKKGARLHYPSMIAIPETKNNRALISIEQNCMIAGDIVLGNNESSDNRQECRIKAGSVITGTIYCDGNLLLNGAVHGCVMTKGFMLRTSGSSYENHLLDATIDVSKLPEMYSTVIRVDKAEKYKMIKLQR